MIWEPIVLALVLGIIISAGLYFAYLWPSGEPVEADPPLASGPAAAPPASERAAPDDAPSSAP